MIKFRSFKPGIKWLAFTPVRFYVWNAYEDMSDRKLGELAIRTQVPFDFSAMDVTTTFVPSLVKDIDMFKISVIPEFDFGGTPVTFDFSVIDTVFGIEGDKITFDFKAEEKTFTIQVPEGAIDFGVEM